MAHLERFEDIKMDIKIVNLTLLKVNGELENFTETIYPAYTYQKILKNPQLRQKLLAYVSDKIPNHYVMLSWERIISMSPESLYFSNREKLEIKNLVQQGVVYLILSELNKKSALGEHNVV
ncbi:MAG: hypothetical protein Fur006_37980 [Coleofasciculaceae cyanobacterium]